MLKNAPFFRSEQVDVYGCQWECIKFPISENPNEQVQVQLVS